MRFLLMAIMLFSVVDFDVEASRKRPIGLTVDVSAARLSASSTPVPTPIVEESYHSIQTLFQLVEETATADPSSPILVAFDLHGTLVRESERSEINSNTLSVPVLVHETLAKFNTLQDKHN